MTGIPADTLRRWESRYRIIVPERTESGYRLYSQHDLDAILWLKARLQEGLSISRACEILRQLGGDPGPQPALTPSGTQRMEAQPQRSDTHSFSALQADLFAAFTVVDEARAGEVLADAFSLYGVEDVCLNVLQPVLVSVGKAWLEGEISVAVEHFASSFTRARLENFFHSSPHNLYAPLVIVGCAPGELHELGAMFLSVFLRRAGYRVIYLGQNVPLDSLTDIIRAMKPQVVCVSATRAETAASLYELRSFLDEIVEKDGSAPLLVYGGGIFNRYPHISERLGGLYLGEDARAVREALHAALNTE